MSDELNTSELHQLLTEMNHGASAARETLVRRIMSRVTLLSRKMLNRFQGMRRLEQTDDIVQGSLVRLLRSLEELKPASMREFFGLANEQIRRELLDLVKRHQAAKRPRLNPLPGGANDSSDAGWEPPAHDESSSEIDRWGQFHEAVAQLPEKEREIVGLLYYQGWSQAEAAEVLAVTTRQVRRYWVSACFQLKQKLQGELPIQ